MLTAPNAYHYGANLGFNVAVSANTILDLPLWRQSLTNTKSVIWPENPCDSCSEDNFDCLDIQLMLDNAQELTNNDLFPLAPR